MWNDGAASYVPYELIHGYLRVSGGTKLVNKYLRVSGSTAEC